MSEARVSVRPVYLVEIALQASGPVLYFSDRNVTVGGQVYEDYIASVTTPAEEALRPTSESLNAPLSIEFRNEPWRGFARLIEAGAEHPFEGGRCTLSEAYIDDAGVCGTPVTLFIGTLDAPAEIDLQGFTCAVSALDYGADNK